MTEIWVHRVPRQNSGRWKSRVAAEVVARWIVAVVLLCAALLKAHQIAHEPLRGAGLLGWRPFWVVVLEIEAAVGFWLVSDVGVRYSRWVAIAMFSGYFVVAVYLATRGAPSCNCFGTAAVSPWSTAALDSSIVILLLMTNSASNSVQSVFGRGKGLAVGSLGAVACTSLLFLSGVHPLRLVHAADLAVDSNSHDYGALKATDGLQLSHDFRVVNKSTTPVRLIKASSTCRCTVAEIPQQSIPPGAEAIIHVTADWRGRFGVQREEVLITTDSSLQPTIALGVTANIVAEAVFWPKVIDFGDVDQADNAVRTVTLAPGAGQRAFRVLEAACDDSSVQLSPRSQENSGAGEAVWVAQLTPGQPRRGAMAVARFKTDLPQHGDILVPITYSVTPAIQASPSALLFWAGKSDDVRVISVKSKEALTDMSIVSGEFDPRDFRIQQTALEPGEGRWSYLLELRLLRKNVEHIGKASLVLSGKRFSVQLEIVVMP